MENIKLKINHYVNFTNDFTKDLTNEFPDEIEDNFTQKFYELEDKYIGLLNTTETSRQYRYDVAYLCNNYKQLTGKNFKIPRSKISWRKY